MLFEWKSCPVLNHLALFHLAYILAFSRKKRGGGGGHDNKVLTHHCCLVRSNITHYMCMKNCLHYVRLKLSVLVI